MFLELYGARKKMGGWNPKLVFLQKANLKDTILSNSRDDFARFWTKLWMVWLLASVFAKLMLQLQASFVLKQRPKSQFFSDWPDISLHNLLVFANTPRIPHTEVQGIWVPLVPFTVGGHFQSALKIFLHLLWKHKYHQNYRKALENVTHIFSVTSGNKHVF